MPMEDDMPMMMEEDVRIVRKLTVMCRSPRIDRLLFSIIIRSLFCIQIPFSLELES